MKNSLVKLGGTKDKTSQAKDLAKEDNSKKQQSNQKESEVHIKEYKSQVEDIRKSNTTLKEQLDAEARLGTIQNLSTAAKIAKLQETGLLYARKIEIESKRNRDLEREIQNAQGFVKSKRAELIDLEGNDADSYGKTIKKLEFQLEKISTENNEALAENRQLKEQINMLRKERVIFDKIYNQLEIELKSKENELKSIIYQTEKVKEEKLKAQEKIEALKKVVSQEQKKIEEEYQNFFKTLNDDNTIMKRGNDTQDNDKLLLINESKFFNNDKKGKDGSPHRDYVYESKNSSPKNKNRDSMKTKTMQIMDEAAKVEKSKKDVEEYEKVFEMLRARTGMKDVDQIIQLFSNYEQENQTLFELVDKVTEEKETLEKKLNELNKEIDMFINQEEHQEIDNPRAENLMELNKKIMEQDKKHENIKKKNDDLLKNIDSIRSAIPVILKKIGYEENAEIKSILDNNDLNEANILICLAYIEKRVDETLLMNEIAQNKESTVNNKKYIDDLLKKTLANEESEQIDTDNLKNSIVLHGSQTEQNQNQMLKEFNSSLGQHMKDNGLRETEKRIDFDEYRGTIKKELQDFLKSKDQTQKERRVGKKFTTKV